MRSIITPLFFCLAAGMASAQSILPATGEILPGWREKTGLHIAGLAITLAPGWKTYWRSPGDGGIPPRFNWSGSKNLKAVSIQYPVPKVMDQNGIRSIGYDTNVTFALLVTARDAKKPVILEGEIDIGVCEDVCIPLAFKVRGTLPAKGVNDSRISAVMKNQPKTGGRFSCEITPIADGLRLVAHVAEPAFEPDTVVVEPGERGVWTSPATIARARDRLEAGVEMVPPNAKPFALARNDIRLTVIGEGRAVEYRGCR